MVVVVVGLASCRGCGRGRHRPLCGRLAVMMVMRVVVMPCHWPGSGGGPAGGGGGGLAGGAPVVGVWPVEDRHPALAPAVDAHEVLVAAVGPVDGGASVLVVGHALPLLFLLLHLDLALGKPVPASAGQLARKVSAHQTLLAAVGGCLASLVVGLDALPLLLLLLSEPGHADAVVLAGKVGAGELLVAAVRRLLAATVHHAVLVVFIIQEWQPGCADTLLVGTPDTVELLVAALDAVAASFEMGAGFVFNI